MHLNCTLFVGLANTGKHCTHSWQEAVTWICSFVYMCKTSSVIAKHQCSSSLSLVLFNWGGGAFKKFFFLAHASWKTSLFSSNCHKEYNCCYTAQDICACWNTRWNDCDTTKQSRFSVHVTRTQCLVLGSCCNLFSVYSIRMVVLSLGQLFGAAVVPCATHCDFVF